jgi:hypothetical protein
LNEIPEKNTSFDSEFNADSEYIILSDKYIEQKKASSSLFFSKTKGAL